MGDEVADWWQRAQLITGNRERSVAVELLGTQADSARHSLAIIKHCPFSLSLPISFFNSTYTPVFLHAAP